MTISVPTEKGKTMRIKTAIDRNQWFIIPCIGVIDERYYYGYPVFAIGFAWLVFRFKVEFGVKTYKQRRKDNERKAD